MPFLFQCPCDLGRFHSDLFVDNIVHNYACIYIHIYIYYYHLFQQIHVHVYVVDLYMYAL